jgi:hypothetical protein
VNVYPAMTVTGSLGPSVPAGYPRPRGATPFRVPLTPAFTSCTAPNSEHGAPLSFPSCNPPQPASAQLTVGTPDANGRGANSIGSVLYQAVTGDPTTAANEADVKVGVSLTDVRRRGSLADYDGELSVQQTVQITDRGNGSAQDEPGTMQASPFRFAVPCAGTSDPSVGGTCALATTFNAIAPGAVVEGRRAIWELGSIDVYDGGGDSLAATTGDNTLFARQGLYVP